MNPEKPVEIQTSPCPQESIPCEQNLSTSHTTAPNPPSQTESKPICSNTSNKKEEKKKETPAESKNVKKGENTQGEKKPPNPKKPKEEKKDKFEEFNLDPGLADLKLDFKLIYNRYANVLKGAEMGKVVTRFPPEPSGYLHIGHVKASLLNYHYSKIYNGIMLLRFDDTNPSKEKLEFVDSIMEDLKTLRISHAKLSYSSDYFGEIPNYAKKMIKAGLAYCDNTPKELMRKQRFDGIESENRNNSVDLNEKIFDEMLQGRKTEYCLRAKISMTTLNKCMRDPVMYRCNVDTPHHRTGTKYKCYPTYDFACPIIDSVEGVTHAMRTNEYADRNEQYRWFQKAMGLRPVTIYDYSRLCFVNSTLSKRKLTWFVEQKLVEGWDDPRFPTVRGILRRGIKVETLIEFMLEQGPSKNTNLQEWDKLFALNAKLIDNLAGRYTSISKECASKIIFTNAPESLEVVNVALHPKNAAMGERPFFRYKEVYIENDDAKIIQVGEKVTLMKWGNIIVKELKANDKNGIDIVAELKLDDKDYKSTKKLTWLPAHEGILVDVELVEYDHLLKVKKLDKTMKIDEGLNLNTKFVTQGWADSGVKNLNKGDVVQFERRGFYILDKISKQENGAKYEFIYIPDGKTKTMSGLSTKVDVSKLTKGNNEQIQKVR